MKQYTQAEFHLMIAGKLADDHNQTVIQRALIASYLGNHETVNISLASCLYAILVPDDIPLLWTFVLIESLLFLWWKIIVVVFHRPPAFSKDCL